MTPRDARARLALIFSIVGSGLLTGFASGIVYVFWKGGFSAATEAARVDYMGKALLGSLATIGIVLVSLGMAINRRSFKISKDGIEAEGGEEA